MSSTGSGSTIFMNSLKPFVAYRNQGTAVNALADLGFDQGDKENFVGILPIKGSQPGGQGHASELRSKQNNK